MRLVGLLAFSAVAVLAQSMGFTPPSMKPTGVTGAPYSAEEEFLHGDRTEKGRKIYRDSEGRVRTERLMCPSCKYYVVEITDPVAGVQWVLDTQHKVAHLMTPQPPPQPAGSSVMINIAPTSTPPSAGPPITKIEQLDPAEIGGLRVVGSRSITTYTDGHKLVGESWMSPELNVVVKNTLGDDIFRLANLKRSEPFPSLFRIPADYTVVEEKTTFVIQYQ